MHMAKMTKNLKAVLAILWSVAVLAVLVILIAQPSLFVRLISVARHSREANNIILAVESYRSKTGQLPATLRDVGQAGIDSSEVFYEKKGKSEYIVWYGLELGESMTYSSSKGRWDDY